MFQNQSLFGLMAMKAISRTCANHGRIALQQSKGPDLDHGSILSFHLRVFFFFFYFKLCIKE